MVMKAVSLNDLNNYQVNRSGQQEAIWQPLYDSSAYAAAGQTSLTFFQVPNGQSSKTLDDTNMELAGSLPMPKRFLIQAIEIAFFSGVTPATHGAQAAANYVNDVNAFYKSGHFQLFIGSKPYLDESPLGVMPPGWGMYVASALADTTTAAADSQSMVQYARPIGRTYEITPVLLESQQNFKVTLSWGTAVALPSTSAGKVFVRLLGTLYRLSQ